MTELDGIQSDITNTNFTAYHNSSSSGSRSDEAQVLLVATCSCTSQLDEAVLRSGRLDVHVTLPLPTVDDLSDIMLVMLNQSGISHVLDRWDVKSIAEKMVTLKGTAALCAGVLNKSKYALMRETIEKRKSEDNSNRDNAVPVLEMRHLSEALSSYSPTLVLSPPLL